MNSSFVRMLMLAGGIVACALIAGAQSTSPSTQKAVSAERINELVKQLGSEDFKAREAAQKELSQIGAPAKAALEQAARMDDLEVKQRTSLLLAEIAQQESADASKQMAKRLLWSAPLAGVTGSPVLCGKALLAITEDGLVAISTQTGKKLWSSELKDATLLAAGGNVAAFANNETLQAVDLKTGKPIWKYDAFGEGKAPSAIVVDESAIYVADSGSKLTALAIADGAEQWKVKCLNTVRPMIRAGNAIVIAGLPGDQPNGVRIGMDNVLAAYSVDKGKELWQARYPVQMVSVAAGKDVVYVLRQQELAAVNLETGKEDWKAKLPETINIYIMRMMVNGRQVAGDSSLAAPVLAGDTLYVLLQQSLIGIDPKTGQQTLSHQLEGAAPSGNADQAIQMKAGVIAINGRVRMSGMPTRGQLLVDDKTAYIQRGDRLTAMDLKDGKTLWSLGVGSPFAGAGVVDNGVLYFATQPGQDDASPGGDGKAKGTSGLNLDSGVHALKLRSD